MNEAVGVMIIDEPGGREPTLRATLEHEPALQTLSEEESFTDAPAGPASVALVFLAEGEATIERIAGLKRRQPRLKVLVAIQAVGSDPLRRLIGAGADAFVADCAPPRDICAMILALARTGTAQVPFNGEPVPTRIPELGDGLTPREAEILRFLSAGFSNKEVARRLSLSVRTVETHRLNLRRKTQTGRLKDLVSLARSLGLAPVLDAEPARRAPGEIVHAARH